jgi:hypothetical protein
VIGGAIINACITLDGKPEGKRLLGRLGIYGRTILKWTLRK